MIAIPVNYFLRIMKIKILFPKHPGQKIRYILRTHAEPEPKKKNSLTFHRSLGQPVVHQRTQLGRSRGHGFRCVSLFKRFHHNIPVNLLGYLGKRFFQFCTLINISFQIIAKRNHFHFFIKIMKNNICILILKGIQTDNLAELLCRLSGKFKILHRIEGNCLFKIKILHSISHRKFSLSLIFLTGRLSRLEAMPLFITGRVSTARCCAVLPIV